jgi:hypothetical protein
VSLLPYSEGAYQTGPGTFRVPTVEFQIFPGLSLRLLNLAASSNIDFVIFLVSTECGDADTTRIITDCGGQRIVEMGGLG